MPLLVGLYALPLLLAFALVSLQCATLPLAVRHPRSATLLHLVSIVLIAVSTHEQLADEFWPLPVPALVALCVLLAILGLREDWILPVVAWWAAFLALAIVVVVYSGELDAMSEWGVDMIITVTVTLLALVASMLVGQRRRVRRIVAEAARDVELEQARRATMEERSRIARELHDVVAHSMSIVHIQAESAQYRVGDLDAARGEFTVIAASARSALSEMRQLLDALRPGEEALYAPQPSLADVPGLLQTTESAGSALTFTTDVEPGTLSPMLELTVYRIVQESLSNAVRHARRAPVTVTVARRADRLEITVENDPAPSGTATEGLDDTGGHGLRGMRERIDLLHGVLQHGPRIDGGYRVSAMLPIHSREELP